MRRMTAEHNERLRTRLLQRRPAGVTARVAPYLAPGGGDAMLSGRF